MKKLFNISLFVMFIHLVYASPGDTGEDKKSISLEELSVELLDVFPEFSAGNDGAIEISSAFLVRDNDKSEELYGTSWSEFKVDIESASESYNTKQWKISEVRLGEELTSETLTHIEKLVLGQLVAKYATLNQESIDAIRKSSNASVARGFSTEVPKFIYTNRPSVLVSISGEPFYETLDKRYSIISNAGAFMIKDTNKDSYHMYGGGLWFVSSSPIEGWTYDDAVPNRIKRVLRNHSRELYDNMDEEMRQVNVVPNILVSTEPAELIATDGVPKYVFIPKTNLVYLENTDAEVFRTVDTDTYYSLFSGRWFRSDSVDGPWQMVQPESIPNGFAKIPESHEKSHVLVSVPGTRAAQEAVRDAQVPYIVKKNITSSVDTKVSYDGEPEFVDVVGTDLDYAQNTSSAVLAWNNNFYLVEDGVWYISSSPHGQWQVATERPIGVENIPADNPLYNVKYVYIYKSTDEEVYTGYTSGYTGSYIYGPTVVFGTGYHYRGWHGHYYFHHPITYGFGFYYDPFYGWGPVYSPWYRSSFYWHWHFRPWYGYRPPFYRPPGYRPPGHRPPGNRPPGNRPPHHRPKPVQPIERPSSTRPSQPSTRPVSPSQPTTRPSQPSTMPSTRPSQPTTRPSQPTTRPSQPSVRPSQPMTRPSQPSMRPSTPSARPSGPSARPAMRR